MKNNVLVIANNKGGTGKSTVSIMSAIFLNKYFDKRVLVIDNSSQANATSSLGFEEQDIEKSLYHMYADEIESTDEIIYETKYKNIDIIPATIELQRAENSIKDIMSRNNQMSNNLGHLKNEYDYIIIDNDAFVNTIFINSLFFADKILIPTKGEKYSEIGMDNVIKMIKQVNDTHSHKIEIAGVVQTFYEDTKIHNDFRNKLLENVLLRSYLLNTKIHKRVCVVENFESVENKRDLFKRNDPSAKKAIEEHLSLVKEVFNLE